MKLVSDPADPRRCKFSYPHEQCWREAEYGPEFCLAHGGKSTEEAESKRLMQLADVNNRRRLAELLGHDGVKQLREARDLAYMMIERQVNNDPSLLSCCASVNNLLMTLAKLTKECLALEQSTGELLPKEAVYRLVQSICEIVVEELRGIEGSEEIIDRIADRLFPTVKAARGSELLRLPAS